VECDDISVVTEFMVGSCFGSRCGVEECGDISVVAEFMVGSWFGSRCGVEECDVISVVTEFMVGSCFGSRCGGAHAAINCACAHASCLLVARGGLG
jgi:hypothetical protein